MDNSDLLHTEIPPRMVIFRHKAASFNLERSVRSCADYIKEPNLSDKKYALFCYVSELKRIEQSRKPYIVMDFNHVVAELFNYLLFKPDTQNYKNWIFLTFFHEDPETLSLQSIKTPDIIEEKVNILLDMMNIYSLRKQIIPLNAIVLYDYLHFIKLEELGKYKGQDIDYSRFIQMNNEKLTVNNY